MHCCISVGIIIFNILSDKIFWNDIGGATLIFDTELISVNGKSADKEANSEL
jgi:hypothetical protein